MIRLLLLLTFLAVLLASPARAQTSTIMVPCQGGTGSPITSVGTTAMTVCAAGYRIYWRVVANGGTYGVIALYCTDDGTTPSSAHYNFVVFANLSTDSSGAPEVSQSAIACISATGSSVPVTASATGETSP